MASSSVLLSSGISISNQASPHIFASYRSVDCGMKKLWEAHAPSRPGSRRGGVFALAEIPFREKVRRREAQRPAPEPGALPKPNAPIVCDDRGSPLQKI